MTAEPKIDYEALVQEAMRGVERSVLKQTVKSGLPGDHHFYISFDTQAPGVNLSKRLKEKYRQEMTIVLQHRFWDLHVNDERFEVKLTFDGIPERLVVPFEAIKVFFDPSVRYGLQFDEPEFTAEAVEQSMSALEGGALEDEFEPDVPESLRPLTTRSSSPRRGRPSRKKPKPAELVDGPEDGFAGAADDTPASEELAANAGEHGADADVDRVEQDTGEQAANGGAEIVSLDAFRKK